MYIFQSSNNNYTKKKIKQISFHKTSLTVHVINSPISRDLHVREYAIFHFFIEITSSKDASMKYNRMKKNSGSNLPIIRKVLRMHLLDRVTYFRLQQLHIKYIF